MIRPICPATIPAILALAACAGPSVRVSTPEPIQLDINMRVDVYQHAAANTDAAPATAAAVPKEATPESRRRNRMAEIQDFKNSRLVGEGRDGLLAVIAEPPGEYGVYVVRTVAEENADRMAVMRSIAERTKRPLPQIQEEQAAEWRMRSFKDEYVEVPDGSGGWRWEKKSG